MCVGRGAVEVRRVLAAGQRAALAGEVVAHRAVGAEDRGARAASPFAWVDVLGRRDRRARGRAIATYAASCVDLLRGELAVALRGLGRGPGAAASGRCRPGSRPRRRRRRSGDGRVVAARRRRGRGSVAQFARNSSRPSAICVLAGVVRRAGPARRERARTAPPVTSRPSSSSTTAASGWRRRAASAVTIALLGTGGARSGVGCPSLEEVDDEEQADPDDVDEVPVVRDHDGAGRLVVA